MRVDRAVTTTSGNGRNAVHGMRDQDSRFFTTEPLNRLPRTDRGGAADQAVLRFRRRHRCLLRRTGRCRHRLIVERGRWWPTVIGLSRFHDVSTHAAHTRWIDAKTRYGVWVDDRRGGRRKTVPLHSLRLPTPSKRSYPVVFRRTSRKKIHMKRFYYCWFHVVVCDRVVICI